MVTCELDQAKSVTFLPVLPFIITDTTFTMTAYLITLPPPLIGGHANRLYIDKSQVTSINYKLKY